MIDKLELMVMHDAHFRQQIANLYCNIRRYHSSSTLLYGAALDLRSLGFDAILHLEHKRYGTHKIELVETGKKTMTDLRNILEAVVDQDPLTHRVSRIDLSADVPGYPLEWFRTHIRVQFKQWKRVHGKLKMEEEFSELGRKDYQSLYFGKRPSCLRVYDKVAERHGEYELWKKRELRKARQRAINQRFPESLPEFPSFLDWLAIDLDLTPAVAAQPELLGVERPRQLVFPIITRVENQLGGSAIRHTKLTSIAGVIENALDFNPFAQIRIVNGGRTDPDFYDRTEHGTYRYTVSQYFAGMYLREHWNDLSASRVSVMLNRDRNRGRLLERFRDFLPVEDDRDISVQDLYERYRDSVSRQLAP